LTTTCGATLHPPLASLEFSREPAIGEALQWIRMNLWNTNPAERPRFLALREALIEENSPVYHPGSSGRRPRSTLPAARM
jgi:hypothetical protein